MPISRRSVVFAMPAIALADRAMAQAVDFTDIERRSGGKLGVYAVDTASGKTLGWRADDRFPFCSSAKGPLAAFVLWKADHGQLSLDRPVRFTESDLLPYAPITRAAVSRGALSLAELCRAAVTFSDNTAANLLWRETGGPQALTSWMRSQGDTAFALTANEPKLNWSRFGDLDNTTTPRAMAGSYRRFVLGDVLSPASRKLLADWLVANTTGGKRLRAGLPAAWRVGDKTGTFDGGWFSTIDIAIAWRAGKSPVVVSGFLTDTRNTTEAERALVEVAHNIALWSA